MCLRVKSAAKTSLLELQGFSDFSLVGAGGNAHVWRAVPDGETDAVAVKIMRGGGDEAITRRFERECALMASLSEIDNVVPILDSNVTEGNDPYLIMPLLEGGSLQTKMDDGPIPWQEALAYILKIAGAASKAHAKRILHLDIKPANVLLDLDGEPHLGDFGISEIIGSTASMSAAMITPAFAPPERLADQKPTEQTDVYGLGATLFALIAGHAPYGSKENTNPAAVITAVLTAPVPVDDIKAEIPEELREVIRQTMDKDPAARPQSVEEFIGLLEAIKPATLARAAADPTTRSDLPRPVEEQRSELTENPTVLVDRTQLPAASTAEDEDSNRPLLLVAGLVFLLLAAGAVFGLTRGGADQTVIGMTEAESVVVTGINTETDSSAEASTTSEARMTGTSTGPESNITASQAPVTTATQASAASTTEADESSTLTADSSSRPCSATLEECSALLTIATRNPNWELALQPTTSDPCEWDGITCQRGSVIGLEVHNTFLGGVMPPELSQLTNLETLWLLGGGLTGPIPSELGNLTNLQQIVLDDNHLTGPIPSEFGNLTDVWMLSIRRNGLTGDIPPELENIRNLNFLSLDQNSLTGQIPPGLGSLNLIELSLGGNNLTGPIPPELGNLTSLVILNLSGNAGLEGALPGELEEVEHLNTGMTGISRS